MKLPSKTIPLKFIISIAILFLVVVLLAACEQKNTYVEPPPPKVTVAEPLQQEVTDYLEFTGNTRAFEEVEIRARVSGFLQSMHFTAGTRVDMGDQLFVIDPREYQAEYNAAEAELNAAKAMQHRAKIEYDRAKRVFDKGAGRETDVVKWRGERDVALAAIERAKANVERAKLNLGYTQIMSPISGRVSRNFVDVGNLEWPRCRMPFDRRELKIDFPLIGIRWSAAKTYCNPRLDPAHGRILSLLIILRGITLSPARESQVTPPNIRNLCFLISTMHRLTWSGSHLWVLRHRDNSSNAAASL